MWPDVLVAALIAFVFLRSAAYVLRKSVRELRMASRLESAV
jgi:Co/Zn/Cd efflux system component